MTLPKNPSPDIGKLAKDLRAGQRAALARAITLIESRRADHQAAARDLVQALLPDTGKAVRVGITGSPGVGKSTTIDTDSATKGPISICPGRRSSSCMARGRWLISRPQLSIKAATRPGIGNSPRPTGKLRVT
jgi:hypothetical protein